MRRNRLDDVFAALLFLAGILWVLASGWVLSRSIAREAELPPPTADPVHIALPEPAPEPPQESPESICHPAIPLSQELQEALYGACEERGVPVALALGVIEVESCFDPDAVSSEGCLGLMQLNPRYFPADKLSPADNLRTGVGWLGDLLERYGDVPAALTAYNAGRDTGSRAYASAVLDAAEWWEEELG